MNKTLLTITTIIFLSIIAYVVMFYLIGFSQKKSFYVSAGAGVAMILVDVALAKLLRRR